MSAWLKTPLGEFIINQERQKCTQLVPSGYYARSLQIGIPWANYCAGIAVSSRFVIDTQYPAQIAPLQTTGEQPEKFADAMPKVESVTQLHQCHYAVSSSSALPFAEKTHDLIILPHTLDFCHDPHEVLRQTSQILVADGHIVIIGFNLISFYGIIKLFKKHNKQTQHNGHYDGHYYGVGRVQDWLALLGFDLVGAAMIIYQPPVQSQKWRERLAFIEKVGDRWWPGLGGVYVVVGRKRVMTVTALPKNTQKWRRLIPSIAQPASQPATSTDYKN